jgi:hypothetical protein
MNDPGNPQKSEWKFSLIKKMNQWRNEVRRLLHDKTTYPEGWSLSRVDPAKALAALSCLSIKPGWKWITFQFMSSGDGNSITFAVPEQVTDQTENWLNQLRNSPHHPLVYAYSGSLLPEAERYFMDTVIGDGSTDSFAQASLLLREIGAIGGYWHGAGWSTCEILQKGWVRDVHPDWELSEGCQLPRNSTPLVFIEENVAHCRFYDQTDMGGRCISLNEDIFFGSSMRPVSVSRMIARSKCGGWFP